MLFLSFLVVFEFEIVECPDVYNKTETRALDHAHSYLVILLLTLVICAACVMQADPRTEPNEQTLDSVLGGLQSPLSWDSTSK